MKREYKLCIWEKKYWNEMKMVIFNAILFFQLRMDLYVQFFSLAPSLFLSIEFICFHFFFHSISINVEHAIWSAWDSKCSNSEQKTRNMPAKKNCETWRKQQQQRTATKRMEPLFTTCVSHEYILDFCSSFHFFYSVLSLIYFILIWGIIICRMKQVLISLQHFSFFFIFYFHFGSNWNEPNTWYNKRGSEKDSVCGINKMMNAENDSQLRMN